MRVQHLNCLFAFLMIFCSTLFVSCARVPDQTAITPTPLIVIPAHTTTSTPTPIPTTTIAATQTPDYILMTVVVKVERTVMVTPTPIPLLAKDCFDSAMTQLDLNSCAASEYQAALQKLNEVVAGISLETEDQQILNDIVMRWLENADGDCDFLYGKLTDEFGSLQYERGSMAPMLVGLCKAERVKTLTEELIWAYGP